jgi:hypothetical protein
MLNHHGNPTKSPKNMCMHHIIHKLVQLQCEHSCWKWHQGVGGIRGGGGGVSPNLTQAPKEEWQLVFFNFLTMV